MEDRLSFPDPKRLHELSQIDPLKISFAILFDWLFIFFLISFCHHFFSWPVYLIYLIFISGQMHALGVLSHEGVHYRISKQKGLNDFIANIFLCWPLFIKVQGYRNEHLPHHNHLNSDSDPDLMRKMNHPDWAFPKKSSSLFRLFLFDILGINLSQYFNRLLFSLKYQSDKKKKKGQKNKLMACSRFLFYLLLFSFLQKSGLWKEYFLYWIIPYLTFFKAIRRMRTLAEHFAINDQGKVHTRTVFPFFWERFLFSHHNVNYHGEHHLFPLVPFYNLKKLHHGLKNSPDLFNRLYFTKGYWGVLKEATQFEGISTKISL